MKRKKITNYILIISVITIIMALAYSINLVYNQQKLLNTSIGVLERIIISVEKLEVERNRLEVENIRLRELENKTADAMEDLD